MQGEYIKVADTKENLMKCICMKCPTHNKCMKDKMGGLFCVRKKTTSEIEKKGCICGECPAYSENGLVGMYYCESGAVE